MELNHHFHYVRWYGSGTHDANSTGGMANGSFCRVPLAVDPLHFTSSHVRPPPPNAELGGWMEQNQASHASQDSIGSTRRVRHYEGDVRLLFGAALAVCRLIDTHTRRRRRRALTHEQ